MNTSRSSIANPNAPKAILTAGLVAGTLDILAAFTQFYIRTGKNPLVILKYIASGVFGKEALSGGTAVMIWGLVFHYMIAFGATLFFFWVYPRLKFMAVNKWATAVVYGLFIWVVTNLVIVPLSLIHKFPSNPVQSVIGALILIVMIGLPLTFIIGNYYSKKEEEA
jgi:hypothetical protein